jgi:hypothetical protein
MRFDSYKSRARQPCEYSVAKVLARRAHNFLSTFARANPFRGAKESLFGFLPGRIRNLLLQLLSRVIDLVLLFEGNQVAIRVGSVFLVVGHSFYSVGPR